MYLCHQSSSSTPPQVLLPPKGDIYDTLSQDTRFSRLVELMKVATLSEELQLGGPYTFFAPTNEAFDLMGDAALDELRRQPDTLKSFLKHHIIVGSSPAQNIHQL